MKPLEKKSSAGRGHQIIVDGILAVIRRDDLTPGARLPSERALADMFKVSRNSIREAIRTLIEKGVLRNHMGAGTYLVDNKVNVLLKDVTEAVHRQRRRIKEIFGFRRMIEPEIVVMAAESITAEDLDFLKLTVYEQERCILEREDDREHDRSFHLRLAQATGNRVIKEVFDTIENIIGESRWNRVNNIRRQRASLQAHIAIIGALERRDAKKARQLMINHLVEMEKAAMGPRDAA